MSAKPFEIIANGCNLTTDNLTPVALVYTDGHGSGQIIAARLVHRYNTHDELVAALKGLIDHQRTMDLAGFVDISEEEKMHEIALERARDTLTKCKKGESND